MSAITGTWQELAFAARSNGTAIASTSSETTYLAGLTGSDQPYIPATFFNGSKVTKSIRIRAFGKFSTTGTPTMIFQFRLSTTQGTSTLSGTSIGVTKAITTGSGVTNELFMAELFLNCRTPGFGTSNCVMQCQGMIFSGGFASPFMYYIEPSTPNQAPGSLTASIDGALTQWVNFSMTWSASSSSNTSTLTEFMMEGLN